MRRRVNCEGGELERGWLQEPVRRSVRGTPETDVFRQHTIGPLRQRQVTLRRNHRRYIQQTPNFFDNIQLLRYISSRAIPPLHHTPTYTHKHRETGVTCYISDARAHTHRENARDFFGFDRFHETRRNLAQVNRFFRFHAISSKEIR